MEVSAKQLTRGDKELLAEAPIFIKGLHSHAVLFAGKYSSHKKSLPRRLISYPTRSITPEGLDSPGTARLCPASFR